LAEQIYIVGLWAALAVLALTVGMLCFYCFVFMLPEWEAKKKRDAIAEKPPRT